MLSLLINKKEQPRETRPLLLVTHIDFKKRTETKNKKKDRTMNISPNSINNIFQI